MKANRIQKPIPKQASSAPFRKCPTKAASGDGVAVPEGVIGVVRFRLTKTSAAPSRLSAAKK